MEAAEYPRMRAAEDRHWWYAALRRVIDLHWHRHVSMPHPRLLDVGCGTGGNLVALATRAEAYGVDMAPAAIAACRARGLAGTLLAKADRLPFPEASFDVVLSCDLLCHRSLPDREVPLLEMRRVLQAGGVLLLNLPAYQWLQGPHDEAYGQDRRFRRPELRTLLRAAGLQPVDATYWNSLLLPLVTLARKLAPHTGSDLARPVGRRVDRLLQGVLSAETLLLQCTSLPFGLSIFIAARKD